MHIVNLHVVNFMKTFYTTYQISTTYIYDWKKYETTYWFKISEFFAFDINKLDTDIARSTVRNQYWILTEKDKEGLEKIYNILDRNYRNFKIIWEDDYRILIEFDDTKEEDLIKIEKLRLENWVRYLHKRSVNINSYMLKK